MSPWLVLTSKILYFCFMKRQLLTLFLSLCITNMVSADLFQAGKPTFEMKSKYFTIFFQEEARRDAEYLSSFADDSYEEICKILRTEPNLRIPIVITQGHESINGYSTSFPYNKIVLYQAPTENDSELGGFDNNIKQLFFHELVHQISLDIKSPFWRFFQTLIGDPISPNSNYMLPLNFIEGVTVSLESLGGFGRTNDPYAAHILFQDAIEGKFRTFDQTQGADERYPFNSIYYLYGGFFSKLLQERSGLEAYSNFFKKTGEGNIFSGLQGAFVESFGLSLDDAWKLFKAKYTDQFPVSKKTKTIDKDFAYYTAVSACENFIYYANAAEKTVFIYDSNTGLNQALFSYGNAISHLSVSPDNKKLLISETYPENGFDKVRIREFDLLTKNFTSRTILHAREGSYAENDIIAIKVNGYKTDLVLYSGTEEKILLKGTYTQSYADPCTIDDMYFAFIYKDSGNSKIARINRNSYELEILESNIPLLKPRFLSAQNGSLNFTYVSDFSLYKLASLSKAELKVQKENLSGAIQMPVQSASGKYFYCARFSSGMRICEYLNDEPELALQTTSYSWQSLPKKNISSTSSDFSLGREPSTNTLPFLAKPFRLPFANGLVEAIIFEKPSEIQYGLSFSFQDEREANKIGLSLGSSIGTPFANTIISWTNSSLPFDFTISALDTYTHNYSSGPIGQRNTGFQLQTQKAFDLSYRDRLIFDLSGTWQLAALRLSLTEHPYELPYEYQSLSGTIGASFTNIRKNSLYPMLKSGFLIDAGFSSGKNIFPSEDFTYSFASLNLGFSVPILFSCINVTTYGIYGTENLYFTPNQAVARGTYRAASIQANYPSFKEYSNLKISNTQNQWYAFGNATLDFLDLPIASSVPFLPIYLNRVKLSIGDRATVFNSELLNSSYARLTILASALIGSGSQAHLAFEIEGYYIPVNLHKNEVEDYGFLFGIAASY